MIKVEVTEENCREVLKRKQDGENICPLCVMDAYKIIQSLIFVIPENGDNDE